MYVNMSWDSGWHNPTEHSSRRIDSLFSICIDYIVKNLPEYTNTTDSLIYFPQCVKTRILKRFLVSSCFWANVNFNNVLSQLVHPFIQHIDLTSVDMNDDILHILKDCHLLREVNLTRVKNYDLTSQGLIQFLKPLKILFKLQLSNCNAVNDDVISTLVNNCPLLSGLDVGGCQQVTNKSLEDISVMQNLQWLNFSESQITSKGIETLISGPSGIKLKELRLLHCNNLTSGVLDKVTQLCPNMQVLAFSNMIKQEDSDTNQETSLPIERTPKSLKQLIWSVEW